MEHSFQFCFPFSFPTYLTRRFCLTSLTSLVQNKTNQFTSQFNLQHPLRHGETTFKHPVTCVNRKNKKVLLRERKRYTARRVAIAISCYSGGGGALDKNFFPSLNIYQAKSGVNNFSLYLGGEGGGPLTENFFPSLNMYQAKSGVKNFPLYWGGGVPRQKFFSRSEHVSSQIWCQNFFPLLRLGTPPKNLRPGTPPKNLRPGPPPRKSET